MSQLDGPGNSPAPSEFPQSADLAEAPGLASQTDMIVAELLKSKNWGSVYSGPEAPINKIIELGQAALPQLLKVLAERNLFSSDPQRVRAAMALREISQHTTLDDTTITAIADSLRDKLTDVRSNIATTLHNLGDPANRQIADALQSNSELAREAACWAVFMKKAAGVGFTDQLIPLLEEEQARIRALALETLANFGPAATRANPQIVEAVEKIIYDPSEFRKVRDQASITIREIDPDWKLDRERFAPVRKEIERHLLQAVRG